MAAGWVADEDYPDGRRLPMTPAETAEVDADTIETAGAWLEAVPHPDETTITAASTMARAAMLLRLGID